MLLSGYTKYQCQHYDSDKGESDDWCHKIGPPYYFTKGKNDDFPGCGGCWCCKEYAPAVPAFAIRGDGKRWIACEDAGCDKWSIFNAKKFPDGTDSGVINNLQRPQYKALGAIDTVAEEAQLGDGICDPGIKHFMCGNGTRWDREVSGEGGLGFGNELGGVGRGCGIASSVPGHCSIPRLYSPRTARFATSEPHNSALICAMRNRAARASRIVGGKKSAG